jgi:hypothetical protein
MVASHGSRLWVAVSIRINAPARYMLPTRIRAAPMVNRPNLARNRLVQTADCPCGYNSIDFWSHEGDCRYDANRPAEALSGQHDYPHSHLTDGRANWESQQLGKQPRAGHSPARGSRPAHCSHAQYRRGDRVCPAERDSECGGDRARRGFTGEPLVGLQIESHESRGADLRPAK